MPRFSNDKRSVMWNWRFTPAEAESIDRLVERLGLDNRADLIRCQLDLMTVVADLLDARDVKPFGLTARSAADELETLAERVGHASPREGAWMAVNAVRAILEERFKAPLAARQAAGSGS